MILQGLLVDFRNFEIMRVIKCDNCKKKISSNAERIDIRIGLSTSAELCKSCGKNVYDELSKMNLIAVPHGSVVGFEKNLKNLKKYVTSSRK